MRTPISAILAAGAATAYAASLSDVCSEANVKAALPADNSIQGITFDASTITTNVVYNDTVTNDAFYPDSTISFCNVTFSYSHAGRDDKVQLKYFLPSPQNFQKRWLSAGGMAYAINSKEDIIPSGVIYGAASGVTDGGFGSFDTNFDEVFLLANGTINYDALYMFGYKGHQEMATIGKAFTKNFFNMSNDEKLYSYYQGCSEGGREGWSQVQRYDDEFDGLVIGAPAMRYAQQQVNHLYANVVEQTLDYYPGTCEMSKIVNATIDACDALDGKVDGVVARTDLCKLHFNVNSTIGLPYYCAPSAASSGTLNFGKRDTKMNPAQNGTVSAKGAAVAQTILEGLHDSKGRLAYFSYQPAADWSMDAGTTYNDETNEWELSIASTGGEFVAKFIELVDSDNLSTLNNVTYDTMVAWMKYAWQTYEDSLQTTTPDLSRFQASGAKILTYHGESDNSIPTASSVHYHESVRNSMYPGMSYNESTAAMGDWYRLFLVPGAAHCAANSLQPNGPFPQTNLEVLIDWVEKGKKPETLPATVLKGDKKGEKGEICAWPLRPYWKENGTVFECQYDQASIDTWNFKFNAYNLPLY